MISIIISIWYANFSFRCLRQSACELMQLTLNALPVPKKQSGGGQMLFVNNLISVRRMNLSPPSEALVCVSENSFQINCSPFSHG